MADHASRPKPVAVLEAASPDPHENMTLRDFIFYDEKTTRIHTDADDNDIRIVTCRDSPYHGLFVNKIPHAPSTYMPCKDLTMKNMSRILRHAALFNSDLKIPSDPAAQIEFRNNWLNKQQEFVEDYERVKKRMNKKLGRR